MNRKLPGGMLPAEAEDRECADAEECNRTGLGRHGERQVLSDRRAEWGIEVTIEVAGHSAEFLYDMRVAARDKQFGTVEGHAPWILQISSAAAGNERADERARNAVVLQDAVCQRAGHFQIAIDRVELQVDGPIETAGTCTHECAYKPSAGAVIFHHAIIVGAAHVQVAVGTKDQARGAAESARSSRNKIALERTGQHVVALDAVGSKAA